MEMEQGEGEKEGSQSHDVKDAEGDRAYLPPPRKESVASPPSCLPSRVQGNQESRLGG